MEQTSNILVDLRTNYSNAPNDNDFKPNINDNNVAIADGDDNDNDDNNQKQIEKINSTKILNEIDKNDSCWNISSYNDYGNISDCLSASFQYFSSKFFEVFFYL